MSMVNTCSAADCILEPENDHGLCVLHSKRSGKGKEELLPAFRALHAQGRIRIYGCDLRDADLSGLMLSSKNIRDSDLTGANLSDVRLDRVGFDGSCLKGVNFEGGILQRVDLKRVTDLTDCRWYETILDGVRMPELTVVGLKTVYTQSHAEDYQKSRYVYRVFKEAYKAEGHQDAAGLFYEREMDMSRQLASGGERLWHTALWVLCGYGERPLRAISVFLSLIFLYAIAYTFLTLVGPDGKITHDFLESLYFSVVTFTTLGYGDVQPVGVARILAGTEALLGIFTISLFIFVFCRRMVR